MVFHQLAQDDLTHPLLNSTGSRHFPRMDKTSFTFVVKNYSSLCGGIGVGEMIESDPFTAGGHSWTIAFYPAGSNEDAHNRGHISLFLRHNQNQNQNQNQNKSGVVDFVCSFTVLDQSSTRLHCGFDEREMYRHFATLQSGQPWGFPMFVKRATVESRRFGYLREDCIKIRADLGVFVDYDRFVFFKVGGKQFYAEESVLAKRCPRLLHEAIPEIERNVFEAMLWFIHKGYLHWQDKKAISDSRSDDPSSFALKMHEAAHYFNLNVFKHNVNPSASLSIIIQRLSYRTTRLYQFFSRNHGAWRARS